MRAPWASDWVHWSIVRVTGRAPGAAEETVLTWWTTPAGVAVCRAAAARRRRPWAVAGAGVLRCRAPAKLPKSTAIATTREPSRLYTRRADRRARLPATTVTPAR